MLTPEKAEINAEKNLENLEYAEKSWKFIHYLNHQFFKEHERIF